MSFGRSRRVRTESWRMALNIIFYFINELFQSLVNPLATFFIAGILIQARRMLNIMAIKKKRIISRAVTLKLNVHIVIPVPLAQVRY